MSNFFDFPEQIRKLARPSISVTDAEEITASYIGGLPPMAADFQWPEHKGRPLTLLANLDVSGMPSIFDWLPQSGRLLFFYDFDEEPVDYKSGHEDGWRVIYLPVSNSVTENMEAPAALSSDFIIEARSVKFEEKMTLPSIEHPLFEQLEMEQDDVDDYFDDALEYDGDEGEGRLGGYSGAAAGADYALKSELISTGTDLGCAYPDEIQDAFVDQLLQAEQDWVLLFEYEVNEEEAPEIFGDKNLSFWIRLADAKLGNFSKVRLHSECS